MLGYFDHNSGESSFFLVQFVQEKADLVEVKQHSKDLANPETYDIQAEAA